jgi:arylsulfatase A-like enzyme
MTTSRPNILFVFTDQQRWDTLGSYGNPMGLTPTLDALAAQGVRFTHAFTPQPLCGPARACLQTGLYATETNVYKNGIPLSDTYDTIAKIASRAGYETGYVGKWHLGGTTTEPVPREYRGGWDHWVVADALELTSTPNEGTLFDRGSHPVHFAKYRVDATTDLALDFLDSWNEERPFFCFVSYLEPHQQNSTDEYAAPDGYAERLQTSLYVPDDLADHPAGNWKESLPGYYGSIRRIDEQLDRLLEHLRSRGVLENTLVVFASDHGCHFRTRNADYKRTAHDASIRVPLIVSGPGFSGGEERDELVTLLDLPPTLAQTMGQEIPPYMRGSSLYERVDRDAVFVQISEAQTGRAIRTARWKYAVRAPELAGYEVASAARYAEELLYDVEADPDELRDLVGDPEYEPVRKELRARLLEEIGRIEGDAPTITERGRSD